MSLFTIGKRYQSDYTVEHIVPFFNGELAISKFLDERYYLQSVPLIREFTTLEFMRFKKLYDELNLELLLPVSEMFLEGDQIVFVYPYQPIQPIRDVVLGAGVNEEQILNWFHQIVQTEASLQAQGIPMYIIRDPRNIGLNADGELRVIFSGIEEVTLYQSALNWSTFLYCIATGEYIDEPMKKLPNKHSLPKSVAKVLQKSFRAKNLQGIQTAIEQQINKGAGMGLIGSIFGSITKKPAQQETSQQNISTPSQNVPDSMVKDLEILEPQSQPKSNQADLDSFDWSVNSNQTQQDDDISAQLEQMYQSMEEQNQKAKKTNTDDMPFEQSANTVNPDPSLTQTQFFTNQAPTTTPTTNNTIEETQTFTSEELPELNSHSQELKPEIDSITTNSQGATEDVKQEPLEQSTRTFTRQSSTLQTEETDETQIFTASDLSSLEAELEAMQLEQQAEQQEQIETIDVGPITPELTKQEDSPSSNEDHMQQLEDLFGELEQLQSDNLNAATNQQSTQIEEPEPIANLEMGEAKVQEQQQSEDAQHSMSKIDTKVQELESLFDEINQLQAVEKTEVIEEKQDEEPMMQSSTTSKLELDLDKSLETASTVVTASVAKEEVKSEPEPITQPEPEDPLERLRLQFEKEQQALLEKQRKKFEERKQALIDQAQADMQKRQQELLSEIEQQEEYILDQLKKDLELQEKEQLEIEKKERKRLEQEFKQRKQEELRKLELTQLEQKHEQEVTKGLEELRQQFAERERTEQEKLDQEFAKRKKEMSEKLAQKLEEQETEFKAQKQKEWEQIVKQYEESGDDDAESDDVKTVTQDSSESTHSDVEDKAKSEVKKEKNEVKDEEKNDDASKQKSKSKSKKTEAKEKEKATKDNKPKRRRRKNKRSKKNLENQKAVEEQKSHDELASQFDDHKQEILAGKSGQDTTSSEEGAN